MNALLLLLSLLSLLLVLLLLVLYNFLQRYGLTGIYEGGISRCLGRQMNVANLHFGESRRKDFNPHCEGTLISKTSNSF
jgi:hypothetical protein